MQEASSPAVVDSQAPTVGVRGTSAPQSTGTIDGTAHDNLAVWAVRWQDDRGGSGIAQLSWDVGDVDNYKSESTAQTHWSIPAGELSPGATRVTVTAADIKGIDSSPVTVDLADTRAPNTRILSRHHAHFVHRMVGFRFGASETHVSFECKIDGRPWRACDQRHVTYRLGRGHHRFMVRAIDSAGNSDPTPAHSRFAIKRRA